MLESIKERLIYTTYPRFNPLQKPLFNIPYLLPNQKCLVTLHGEAPLEEVSLDTTCANGELPICDGAFTLIFQVLPPSTRLQSLGGIFRRV